MEINLTHIDESEKYQPKYNDNEWNDYVLTEEDSKKSPLLRNIKMTNEKNKDVIKINKDKTQLHIYNSFGDDVIFDLKNEKIISFSLGF